MAPEETWKPVKVSKEAFDIISNRIAVAIARRESLIKSWTAVSSSLAQSIETEEEELEAEALFRDVPPHLGVGAPIPSHFLVSEAERTNKSLRAKFFPPKGLKASKARDAEEKAASAKRGLNQESSDEEEGRSALGRAKKQKMSRREPAKEAKHIPSLADFHQESRPKLEKVKKQRDASSVGHNETVKHTEAATSSDLDSTSKLGKAKKLMSKRPDFDEESRSNPEELKESRSTVKSEAKPTISHAASNADYGEGSRAKVGKIRKHRTTIRAPLNDGLNSSQSGLEQVRKPKSKAESLPITNQTLADANFEQESQIRPLDVLNDRSKSKTVKLLPAVGNQDTLENQQTSNVRDPNNPVLISTTVLPQIKKAQLSVAKDQPHLVLVDTPKLDHNQTQKLGPDFSGTLTGDERRRARKKEKKLLKKLRQAELAAKS